MRTVSALLASAVLSVAAGCATSQPIGTATIPDQSVVRTETTIRVASVLATKAALIATDDREVGRTARSVNAVAGTVLRAADDPDFAVGVVRAAAARAIAGRGDLTEKQKLVAGQLLDTIVLLVQSHLENDVGPTPSVEAVRRLVKAAASGVADATAAWATTE